MHILGFYSSLGLFWSLDQNWPLCSYTWSSRLAASGEQRGGRVGVKQWGWKEAPGGKSLPTVLPFSVHCMESGPEPPPAPRASGVADETWAQQRCPCRCLLWLCSYPRLPVQTEQQLSSHAIGTLRNTLGWLSMATIQPAIWYSCLCTSFPPSACPRCWVVCHSLD